MFSGLCLRRIRLRFVFFRPVVLEDVVGFLVVLVLVGTEWNSFSGFSFVAIVMLSILVILKLHCFGRDVFEV